MEYSHITSFLEKFKKILFQKEEVYKIIASVISEHISFLIEPNSIKIKNTTIYIQGSPTLKNEILINKNKIILKLKEVVPEFNLIDIK